MGMLLDHDSNGPVVCPENQRGLTIVDHPLHALIVAEAVNAELLVTNAADDSAIRREGVQPSTGTRGCAKRDVSIRGRNRNRFRQWAPRHDGDVSTGRLHTDGPLDFTEVDVAQGRRDIHSVNVRSGYGDMQSLQAGLRVERGCSNPQDRSTTFLECLDRPVDVIERGLGISHSVDRVRRSRADVDVGFPGGVSRGLDGHFTGKGHDIDGNGPRDIQWLPRPEDRLSTASQQQAG